MSTSVAKWNFNRLGHRNKLVHQIVMKHRSKSFACNMVFMIFRLRRFNSLPCGFMRFHFSLINRFGSLLGCILRLRTQFRDALWRFFTRRGWCHRSIQFLSRIFEHFFVFFVIRIDEVNSPQSSSIVEFGFLFCPFRFFSMLSGFTNFRPYF